jgi:hypothetical protein
VPWDLSPGEIQFQCIGKTKTNFRGQGPRVEPLRPTGDRGAEITPRFSRWLSRTSFPGYHGSPWADIRTRCNWESVSCADYSVGRAFRWRGPKTGGIRPEIVLQELHLDARTKESEQTNWPPAPRGHHSPGLAIPNKTVSSSTRLVLDDVYQTHRHTAGPIRLARMRDIHG